MTEHTKKETTIPPELKRWNWGAFLFTVIWSIRHKVWQGLLFFVPFFGIFVPFWLGATGNQKAWAKNPQENLENFMKRQRLWGFAGLFVSIGLVFFAFLFIFYANNSSQMEMALRTANSNQRLIDYFGESIHKNSSNINYEHIISPKATTLTIGFDALGTKNEGRIHFEWEKRDDDWVAVAIAFKDSAGMTYYLADPPILDSSFLPEVPYTKNKLDFMLTHLIQKKDGFVILKRSDEKNDFIQTAIEHLDTGELVFDVVYSDGYSRQNKKLYQSKVPIKDKAQVINLFSHYASGDDTHVNSIEWKKLTSIIPISGSIGTFIFDESENL